MSDAYWTAFFLFAGIALTQLLQIINGVLSWRNGRKLTDVHDAVNGGWADVNTKLRTATDALLTATADNRATLANNEALKVELAQLRRLLAKQT